MTMWSGRWLRALALCLVATGLFANDATEHHATLRKPATYRAGIVEFKPPPPAETGRETIIINAKLYAEYAARAAEMGVQILVFPEYGLVGLSTLGNRTSMESYLQEVPDPTLHQWNPCQDPDKFNHTEVLHELSCAASEHSLIIVANLLSREPCDNATSPHKCPADGHYQFNTNVIFAQNGTLIARYHKRHLFMEEDFADPAPESEYVILDLGFVRIATVVCFDLLYSRPTVELVKKHGVRNIAYPTAWVNTLPFWTAPQAFSSVAYGLGINILAANFFGPETGSMGSGIFSSTNGVLNGTWDVSAPGRLVIADVPVDPPSVDSNNDPSLTCALAQHVHEENYLRPGKPGGEHYIDTHVPSLKPANETHRIYYDSLKGFVYANLTDTEGHIAHLCQGSLCCSLNYAFASRDDRDFYKFVAKSGTNTVPGGYNLGMQFCSVLRCKSADDLESCGRLPDPSHTPTTIFQRLTINGRFDSDYLYPKIYSTNLELVSTNMWSFSKRDCRDENGNLNIVGRLNVTTDIQTPILEASIISRVYEWDT